MAKQTFPEVAAGDISWDAGYESWRDILGAKPFPLYSVADIASLPAADQNDDGMCVAQDNDGTSYTGKVVCVSDGPDSVSYKKLAWQTAEVVNLTDNSGGTDGGDTVAVITDPADSPADADALRDDLVTNTISELRDAIATLAAKVNELQTAMKDAGAMDD